MKIEIKTVWAGFFSPTGGTKTGVTTVAGALAQHLGVAYKEMDFTLPTTRVEEHSFGAFDLVVLGTPVIAGRVPNLLLPYLKEKLRGNGAYVVPMVSFGNRNFDDALIELRNIAEANGFLSVAGGAFVSEHSFSEILAAGRPDEADTKTLLTFANDVAQKLADGWEYIEPVYVAGNGENPVYYKPRSASGEHIDIRKVKPVTDERCTECGICVENCPLGAIDFANPKATVGICMKCCACVKKCPTGAKHFEDAGFLFHKQDLEAQFARRAEASYFL